MAESKLKWKMIEVNRMRKAHWAVALVRSFDQVIEDDDDSVPYNVSEQEVEDELPIFRRFHTWPLIEEKLFGVQAEAKP